MVYGSVEAIIQSNINVIKKKIIFNIEFLVPMRESNLKLP